MCRANAQDLPRQVQAVNAERRKLVNAADASYRAAFRATAVRAPPIAVMRRSDGTVTARIDEMHDALVARLLRACLALALVLCLSSACLACLAPIWQLSGMCRALV